DSLPVTVGQTGLFLTKMKLLLLLSLGLVLTIYTEGRSDEEKIFVPEKISGEWYSIALASDRKDKIKEDGSMRVFVEHIYTFENSSLGFKFHTKADGKCNEGYVVADQIPNSNVYVVEYDGSNAFSILDTDYDSFCILYSVNVDNGKKLQLMELYGRTTNLSPEIKDKFGELAQQHRIPQENILDLTNTDRCLQARDEAQS
ncbi:lipocalin/fatty-acid binding family protein, partial [Salmonella enterica]|nr:lipocalin/fatty-acid binding family protein [Salmonella enterica]